MLKLRRIVAGAGFESFAKFILNEVKDSGQALRPSGLPAGRVMRCYISEYDNVVPNILA